MMLGTYLGLRRLWKPARAGAAIACIVPSLAFRAAGADDSLRAPYEEVRHRLASGWNTWNSNSVLSHVLTPDGLSVTIRLHSLPLAGQQYLTEAQPSGGPKNPSPITLRAHTVDGTYSELVLDWQGLKTRVQSANHDGELYVLVSPETVPEKAPIADVEVGMLWNRPGTLRLGGDEIVADLPRGKVLLFSIGQPADDPMVEASAPYWAYSTAGRIAITSGKRRSLQEVEEVIEQAREAERKACKRSGVAEDTVEAVQSAIGWDTIYDPVRNRVISPVSRQWNVGWGGYVLFEWDTFFAGFIAGFFSRDLAYANVIEMLSEATPAGLVPNYSSSRGIKSFDRSEPPVGALVVNRLYRRFHDRWFLEATYPRLLRWNRWWNDHRQVDGYLVWGSDPTDEAHRRDDPEVDTLQAAKYESGLDNSPMFDGARYDGKSHKMRQADVGLMSLYIADCDSLAEIASSLGRTEEAKELENRAAAYRSKLATMWSPGAGLFLNKNLDTGVFNSTTSPTNFYPLLARVPTADQAAQMVEGCLLNPDQFWGDWVLPSTPRNEGAFKDNFYWRGRIWGPMNFLVYLGLRNYDFAGTRQSLATKSEALLLKEWRSRGHIHENYNATTGEGDDVSSSDPFYHWGALLGVMQMIEASNSD